MPAPTGVFLPVPGTRGTLDGLVVAVQHGERSLEPDGAPGAHGGRGGLLF